MGGRAATSPSGSAGDDGEEADFDPNKMPVFRRKIYTHIMSPRRVDGGVKNNHSGTGGAFLPPQQRRRHAPSKYSKVPYLPPTIKSSTRRRR